ncbi:MAG: hypothetical protein QGI21_01765 [Candidatus Poseidoniaceae archaeon]|jgi:hypothetical protein|nr:hypothetical protein [Candidatus Poseidoniaceae archaeon]
MALDSLNLNGGLFRLTLPYTFWGWLSFGLGLLMFIVGIILLFMGIDEIGIFSIPIVGLIILMTMCPGSFESELHNVRKSSIDPEELEAKAKASGLSIDNWFLRQTTYVPTTDANDWILPAPGPASWNEEDRYGPHGDGSPLPEHPVKVGTPIPATITLYGVYGIFLVGFLLLLASALMEDLFRVGQESLDSDYWYLPAAVIVIGLISTVIGYFRTRMLQQMVDTPTSLVRSMSVGNSELVGQVRPSPEGVLTVVVDGNKSMIMYNMVAYSWTYEQYRCRTVHTKDGTREECHWVTVRSDSGGCPFILHDGTGGVRVLTETFKRKEWGQYLKRWDSAFARNLGEEFLSSLAGARDHRWTLYGLKLGHPVYLLGEAKPRTRESITQERLDGTLGNSIIEVWGDQDAPGVRCTIQRGTELSNLAKSRSGFELIALPALLLLGGIALFGLA